MNVEIKENGEYLIVKTPYLPLFVDEIKKLIPKSDRLFKGGAWWVKNTPDNKKVVEKLVSKYFKELTEALLVAVADGEPPKIGGMSLISYSRDYYSTKSTEFFHVVEAERVGSSGSRRHPTWYGYVLAIVKINQNIPIEAYYYRLFKKSADNLEVLAEFVRELADKHRDDIDKAIEEIEKLDIEELKLNKKSNIKGIFDPIDKVLDEVQNTATTGGNPTDLKKILERLRDELERRVKFVDGLLEVINKRV